MPADAPRYQPAGQDGARFKALRQVSAALGRQSCPLALSHVQPHAHATARIARYLVERCCRNNCGPSFEEVEAGAFLHDVGKYLIDYAVLLKPGAFDDAERSAMSRHPVLGTAVVVTHPDATEAIRRTVLYHHEWWDGGGYPEGIAGPAIPVEARVVAVADVYTSLRARRPYKASLPKGEALDCLAGMAGRQLDPSLVEDFLSMFRGDVIRF